MKMQNYIKQEIDYLIKNLPLKIDKFKGEAERIPSLPHFHIYEIEIQFIKEGDGYYFIKDKKYKIEKGKVLLIHKKDLHYFIKPEYKTDLSKICIMMRKELLGENLNFFKSIFKCKENHEIYLGYRDFILSEILLEEIIEVIKNRTKFQDVKFLTKLNLSKFFLILKNNLKNKKFKKDEIFDARIQRAIEFINNNYNRKISEKEICEDIGVSHYYFSHLFKKITGLSFRKYLIEKRLFEAEKLLQNEKLKLETISKKLGFSYLSLFLKEFKQKFGITPTDYRRLYRKI